MLHFFGLFFNKTLQSSADSSRASSKHNCVCTQRVYHPEHVGIMTWITEYGEHQGRTACVTPLWALPFTAVGPAESPKGRSLRHSPAPWGSPPTISETSLDSASQLRQDLGHQRDVGRICIGCYSKALCTQKAQRRILALFFLREGPPLL